MGSDQYDSEKPIHEVAVPDFYIGQYPVTSDEYDAFCTATKKEEPRSSGGKGKQSVINVNWHDAKAYCEWLSSLTKKIYRLPSEAEWEYAARGGTLSKGFKYAGSNNLNEVGWFYDNRKTKKSTWLGLGKETEHISYSTYPRNKKPNELGLYDMSGNVWEWCEDDWHGNYNNAPRDGEAWIDSGGRGDCRVHRGGSWLNDARFCRIAGRYPAAPSDRGNFFGFRLVSHF